MDAQRTFNARRSHASGTLVKQYLIISERAWSVHWHASNVRQTRSKRIQRTCSPRGTYSKRISHTPGTHRASRKFLSMFKFFSSQTRTKRTMIFSDLLRRASDVHQAYTTYSKRVSNVSPTCVWRMWNFAIFQHARRAFHLYANV